MIEPIKLQVCKKRKMQPFQNIAKLLALKQIMYCIWTALCKRLIQLQATMDRTTLTAGEVSGHALVCRGTITHNHGSRNRMWLIEPFPHQQTEGQMFHQPRYTIYYWPVATWRVVIHDNTLCSVCHKFWPADNTEIWVWVLRYLFIQGGQALSHLCLLVHIFTSAPQGVIHQIKRPRAGSDVGYYVVRAVENDTGCLILSAAVPKGSPGIPLLVAAWWFRMGTKSSWKHWAVNGPI